MKDRVRDKLVLAVCNIDTMAGILLRPWLKGLRAAGYEVHIACSPGPLFEGLQNDGFETHAIDVRRRFNPLANIRSVIQTLRLIRQKRYSIVNTHSPIGAAVGRVAAWLAGAPRVVYTVHGFYFHENMPAWQRFPLIAIEKLLGKVTSYFMFVSEEDRKTALRYGIASRDSCTTTIYNGVDTQHFAPPAPPRRDVRLGSHLHPDRPVIGIVGRIVREKGYREFLEMAKRLLQAGQKATFLVVGDCLPSDRDQWGRKLKDKVRAEGLSDYFAFTGLIDDVAGALQAMDIFVLPSYREGFPRSILEAMATGLPVVSTDIRGCREAVLHGKTGLIVPPRDAKSLTAAVAKLLQEPELAIAMGQAGRERVTAMFDEVDVQQRFIRVFEHLSPPEVN
jgi:glycosyltransferase involved in cell wall biosynthesis